MVKLRTQGERRDETGQGPAAGDHRTSVVERGSFAGALCTCGWKGPARRARDRARRDAREHTAG
ncbi:hypothetical protein [Streptomyces sp. NBC_01477]|uniref:hypothetical protein n=1 Tax=Streptomyces sp. NBC_01477 TaxID=2976015 RepID=UPI003FCE36A9